MQVILKNDIVLAYVSDVRNIKDFLPTGSPSKITMNVDNRVLEYGKDKYTIKGTQKVKGIAIGDICVVCSLGDVVDAGGCSTCNKCGAQLKCGL